MSRRSGFTLVEVLVAMVVAVAALTMLAQGFQAGARASVLSQQATRASLLAQRVLTGFETGELTMNQSHSGAFEEEPEYRWETLSETFEPSVYLVTVRVVYEDRGRPRAFELVRLFRERTETP